MQEGRDGEQKEGSCGRESAVRIGAQARHTFQRRRGESLLEQEAFPKL